jgi:hypothetical protein
MPDTAVHTRAVAAGSSHAMTSRVGQRNHPLVTVIANA